MKRRSATALAGQGLMGVARDNHPREGSSKSFVTAFAEVEVDIDTGITKVRKIVCVQDCGLVIDLKLAESQVYGALIMGVLRNGLNLLDVSAYWQMVVIGCVIVAAVFVDVLRQRGVRTA